MPHDAVTGRVISPLSCGTVLAKTVSAGHYAWESARQWPSIWRNQ